MFEKIFSKRAKFFWLTFGFKSSVLQLLMVMRFDYCNVFFSGLF